MGQRHAFVEVAAVRSIANRLDAAADVTGSAVRTHLAGLTFCGATAGRAHTARGDALRTALDRLSAELSQWSRAAAEIAVALRATADRYTDAEMGAAARIG